MDDRPETRAGDAFWRFSLSTYRASGVAPACLAFQDEGGGDVNLLLFCLWCGRAAGSLPDVALGEAIALSRRWRARVVEPLRSLRRDLKSGVDGFEAEAIRERIKATELAAEEAQQRRIAPIALAAVGPPGEAAASALLERYLSALSDGLTPRAAEAARRHGARVAELSRDLPVPLLEF